MISRTIFKKIEDANEKISSEIKVVEDKGRLELLKQQKDLLDEVKAYVNSYDWLTHQYSKERIQFFIKNKYSYKEFSKHYNVKEKAAHVSVSYANQKCIDKIGKNTIDLILEGRLDEARTTFYFRTGRLKLKDFIVDSALPYVPEPNYMTVHIEDCNKELTFLRLFSKAYLDIAVKEIDKEKMAYLRYIIEGDNPKLAEERLYLLELLKGKTTVKDYIQQAKERNIY